MSSRKFVKGIVRTMKAIDRDAKRAARRREAIERAALKVELLEEAAAAAGQYDDLVSALTRAHCVSFRPIDWAQASKVSPLAPARSSAAEDAARRKAEAYQPGFFAKLTGSDAAKRNELQAAINEARRQDDRDFQRQVDQAAKAKAKAETAKLILAQDQQAMVDALETSSALGDLPFSVEGIDLIFKDGARVVALVDGLDIEDMPEQSVTLLQSGKASVKALPKAKVMEMHRDNIASSVLRVAVEILQTLPLDGCEVVMMSDLLDPATGHIEPLPIMHLKVSRQALEPINLMRVDALALADRLGATYRWSRKDGFAPIDTASLDIVALS